MRPADVPGTRRWPLLPAAAALVSSGLAAGCSSKPAYCADAGQLKTSVQNLGNVDVATNGLSSLQTALTSVQTSYPAGP
jgi:outer membrane murein-binding lipoprotein Lpp